MSHAELPPAYSEVACTTATPQALAGADEIPGEAAPPPYQREGLHRRRYIGVSASQTCVYLLRSDGIVDRSTQGGVVSTQLKAPPPLRYTGVAAGRDCAYLVRSDGCVVRTSQGSVTLPVAERHPPPSVRYISAASGCRASYFVRDDGVVDRATTGGRVASELRPAGWPAVKYTRATAGLQGSLLLRSDGVVDRVCGGRVANQLRAAGGSARYVGIGEHVEVRTDDSTRMNRYFYLLRSDGAADRYRSWEGTLTKTMRADAPFVGTASGLQQSYLITADGVAERIYSGECSHRLRPAAQGAKYIAASCGHSVSYLLRDDGTVDRTMQAGNVHWEMEPPTEQEFQQHRNDGVGCAIS